MDTTTADNYITQAFQKYLGRAPAAAGLSTYAYELQSGMPLATVQNQIASSAEAQLYNATGVALTPDQAAGFAEMTPAQQQAQIEYAYSSTPDNYIPPEGASNIAYVNAGGANSVPTGGFDPGGMTFQQLAAAVNAGSLPAPTSGGTPNTGLTSSLDLSLLTFDGVPITVLGYGGGSNPGVGQILLGSGATNAGWAYGGQPISVSQQGALYSYLTGKQLNRGWAEFLIAAVGGAIAGTIGAAASAGSDTVQTVGEFGAGSIGGTGAGLEPAATDLTAGSLGGAGGVADAGVQTITVTSTSLAATGSGLVAPAVASVAAGAAAAAALGGGATAAPAPGSTDLSSNASSEPATSTSSTSATTNSTDWTQQALNKISSTAQSTLTNKLIGAAIAAVVGAATHTSKTNSVGANGQLMTTTTVTDQNGNVISSVTAPATGISAFLSTPTGLIAAALGILLVASAVN